MADFRIEHDSIGEVRIPADALYGAQTQRAIDNFPISGLRFLRSFIGALGLIKKAAAETNAELGLLDIEKARAIALAADEVASGRWDSQFPVDVFQSGSGTSTNMNANEVIAGRASIILEGASSSRSVHPNDHVNMCQSTNDVIPSAIHISAFMLTNGLLLPALRHLREVLDKRASELDDIVKTGRTHLMDAVPIRMGQEISGWAFLIGQDIERIESCLPRLAKLTLGGTAVGTGTNAHPEFGKRTAAKLSDYTGLPFAETGNHFAFQSAMGTAIELSSRVKTTALSLMKISNDLRLMNSGPVAGFSEISLPAHQLGSSIMPGKINPVICEAMIMVGAQVIGNDTTIAVSNQCSNFEVNIMLPLIAHNLLESISIMGNATQLLADKAVAGFTVNREHIARLVERNPILGTALSPVIGYEKASMIVKKAYAEGRSIKAVAAEMTDIPPEELDRLLDPRSMTGK